MNFLYWRKFGPKFAPFDLKLWRILQTTNAVPFVSQSSTKFLGSWARKGSVFCQGGRWFDSKKNQICQKNRPSAEKDSVFGFSSFRQKSSGFGSVWFFGMKSDDDKMFDSVHWQAYFWNLSILWLTQHVSNYLKLLKRN